MGGLNTNYLTTNRGVIKIIQIVLGFIICSLLCATWHGGKSCFYEGRIGSVSGLNFIILIINIVLYILNFLNVSVWKLEKIYSIVATILFLIAAIVLIWFIIVHEDNRNFMIASTVLIATQFFLFLWDVKILQGEASN